MLIQIIGNMTILQITRNYRAPEHMSFMSDIFEYINEAFSYILVSK